MCEKSLFNTFITYLACSVAFQIKVYLIYLRFKRMCTSHKIFFFFDQPDSRFVPQKLFLECPTQAFKSKGWISKLMQYLAAAMQLNKAILYRLQLAHLQEFLRYVLRGCSQTTFTRRGRQVVQKCPLFANVHTIENVNGGGQVVKKIKILSAQFVNDPLCK